MVSFLRRDGRRCSLQSACPAWWKQCWIQSPSPTYLLRHTYTRKSNSLELKFWQTEEAAKWFFGLNKAYDVYCLLKPGSPFPVLLPHLLSRLTRSQSWDKFGCLWSLSNRDWISRYTSVEWTCRFNFELSCFLLAYSTTFKFSFAFKARSLLQNGDARIVAFSAKKRWDVKKQ